MCLFLEKKILRFNTFAISYIVPNKFIGAKYATESRNLACKLHVLEIRNYSSIDVFKEADVYPVVFIIEKNNKREPVVMTLMEDVDLEQSKNHIQPDVFYKNTYWDIYFLPNQVFNIFERLSEFKTLGSPVSTVITLFNQRSRLIVFLENC
ncbi:hypothetical protein O77CONTIG1_04282 [Leptolyngbya sp. O-77]|nr:hypothetical protein O77CONTIG1_04282 [Leptolyngbya sp. O-77]